MSASPLHLVFRGVRGSIPTPGEETRGYGGNTTCLEIVLDARRRLLLDCGTGLRAVQAGLTAADAPRQFHVLLTHYHADHVMGLPFFRPLFDARSEFTFYGVGWQGRGVQACLEQAVGPPAFPVPLPDTHSRKRFVDLDGGCIRLDDLTIRHARLNHPQGVTAYRLEWDGRAVVFATDHEPENGGGDARLRDLAAGADLLIHDAQYTPEEYEDRRGWGHSSWWHAVENARAAAVGRLILFHHDPDRRDAGLDAMVREAARAFPALEAAREGMSIPL